MSCDLLWWTPECDTRPCSDCDEDECIYGYSNKEIRSDDKEIRSDDRNILQTDKKANAAYWDNIEISIMDFVSGIAEWYSVTKTDKDDIEESMVEEGLVPELRDMIVEFLERHGGTFPVVDEDM